MTQDHKHEQHEPEHDHAQDIIKRNQGFLWNMVRSFMQRGGRECISGVYDKDDLYQEAALAFLQEVERYGESEAIRHSLTIFHSMYGVAMGAYPLSMPKRSATFKKTREKMGYTFTPMYELKEEHKIEAYSMTDYLIDQAQSREEIISGLEAAAELTEEERNIFELKAQGMNQKEIAKILKLSGATISRRIQGIRKKLKANRVFQ